MEFASLSWEKGRNQEIEANVSYFVGNKPCFIDQLYSVKFVYDDNVPHIDIDDFQEIDLHPSFNVQFQQFTFNKYSGKLEIKGISSKNGESYKVVVALNRI